MRFVGIDIAAEKHVVAVVGDTERVAGVVVTPLWTKPSDQVSVQGPLPTRSTVSVAGLPEQTEVDPETLAGIAHPMSRRPWP